MTHEVYIVRYKGEVLYIGEGKKGRSEHVHSGVSNIYTLNKLHFSGEVFDMEVISCDCKEQSKELEKKLIKSLRPLYNTEHSKTEYELKSMRRELKVFDQEYLPELYSNPTYGVIKASVKNMSNQMTSLVTPTDLRIACPGIVGHNGIASTITRFYNNPTSKLHWFLDNFDRTEVNGLYRLKLKEELLGQGIFTRYLTRAFITKGKQ